MLIPLLNLIKKSARLIKATHSIMYSRLDLITTKK